MASVAVSPLAFPGISAPAHGPHDRPAGPGPSAHGLAQYLSHSRFSAEGEMGTWDRTVTKINAPSHSHEIFLPTARGIEIARQRIIHTFL